MNLQNLGVQELNAKELRETDGGGWWNVVRNILLAVAAAHSDCTGHSGTYINQGGTTVATYEMH